MKLVWRVAAVAGIIAGVACCGCGKDRKPQAPGPAAASSVPLPEWAPKNPSSEFLRAARVLKPIPPELWGNLGDQAPPAMKAMIAKLPKTYPPAWEFFGTLSDDEVERFKSSGVARVPVRRMTKTQRRLLDAYFTAYREAMAPDDFLVALYRDGANEDLSNVDAGFIPDNHMVKLQFWITREDSTISTYSADIATR